jgi:hypothetical protein
MTKRKADIALTARTPAFVDRKSGAAELVISPETWDRWVADGTLPPPAPGFPLSTPRWRWADVDRKLSQPRVDESEADVFIARAGAVSGSTPNRKHRAP